MLPAENLVSRKRGIVQPNTRCVRLQLAALINSLGAQGQLNTRDRV